MGPMECEWDFLINPVVLLNQILLFGQEDLLMWTTSYGIGAEIPTS